MNPVARQRSHPILKGIAGEWPVFLGYNRFTARPEGNVLLTIGDDPFLVVWTITRDAQRRSPRTVARTGDRRIP